MAADEGLLRSAHDVSGGGLAVALAESAMAGGIGATLRLASGPRDDEVLFGEGGGRMLLSVADLRRRRRSASGRRRAVRLRRRGHRGRRRRSPPGSATTRPRLSLDDARDAYERGLPEALA